MSFSYPSPQFGNILHTWECDYCGLGVLVVLEECHPDLWVIIYRRRKGDYEIFGRYIFFDKWTIRDYRSVRNRVFGVGISLDKGNNHLVVEQGSDLCCMLIFDGSRQEELLMAPLWRRRETYEYSATIETRVSLSALRRLACMRGEIVDRRMVVTCFYRKAYVLEKVLDDLWLDVYIWVDALWKIQSSFRSAEIGRFGVHPLRAPIVNVFVSDSIFSQRIVVMEESDMLRWWHNYEGDGQSWRHRTSSEVLLNRSVILSATRIDCDEEQDSADPFSFRPME
jgi:hypothetical protein